MEYLTIGKIIATHGLKGELKVYSSTDFPNIRYKKGKTIFIYNESEEQIAAVTVKHHYRVGQFDFVLFDNYDDINLVTSFLKCELRAEKDTTILPKKTYFITDLKKCKVYDEEDHYLGEVIEVEQFTSQQTLRIKAQNNKIILVPFVDAFIKKVNIGNGKIIIHVIEGLLWKLPF